MTEILKENPSFAKSKCEIGDLCSAEKPIYAVCSAEINYGRMLSENEIGIFLGWATITSSCTPEDQYYEEVVLFRDKIFLVPIRSLHKNIIK